MKYDRELWANTVTAMQVSFMFLTNILADLFIFLTESGGDKEQEAGSSYLPEDEVGKEDPESQGY